MKHPASDIREWFDALQQPRHKLTTWEANFIESVLAQFEERGSVSDRQEEILERIYAEKT